VSRWTAISELAALLHCEALILLQAYFDESGTHDEAAVTVIAGYIAPERAWKTLEQQWQEVLTNHDIKVFHMVDFLAQEGEFALMETPEREDLISALIAVIVESDIHAIWSGVDAKSWAAVTTPNFRAVFPKPYDLCFHGVLRQLSNWSNLYAGGSRVATVFAVQDEYNDRSERFLKSWKRYTDCGTLGAIGFDYPSRLPALQPSDMFAHELRLSWESFVLKTASPGKITTSPILRAIWKGKGMGGTFTGDAAIKLHVANPDWLDPSFPCPKAEQPS